MCRNQLWVEAACRIEPVQHLVAQVSGSGEMANFKRGLVREAGTLEDTGREGKVSSVKHELGVGRGGCLDAQVAKHGVGLPAAKQHNCFSVPALAQRRAVAPPGHKERAVTFLARMLVLASCTLAACWMALVTQVDLAGVGRLMDGWRFWMV